MVAPAHTPHNINDSVFAGNQLNPKVVRRAQQVAARQYYQPSPETPHTAEIRTSLQYLRGLGRKEDTTNRRGGQPNPKEAAVEGILTSTVPASALAARKPRALFMSSENKFNNTHPEPEADDSMDNGQSDDEKPTVEKERDNALNDEEGDSEGVQSILELLCVLGSAWRRLCQVRFSFTLRCQRTI